MKRYLAYVTVMLMMLMVFAVTANAVEIVVADYWGVGGDWIGQPWPEGDPADSNHQLLHAQNDPAGGVNPDTIEYVMDLGQVEAIGSIGIQNRGPDAAYHANPERAEIYVAADESDPNFDPTDINDFTVQINLSYPLDDRFSGDLYAAGAKRYIDVEPGYDRQYVMVKMTANRNGAFTAYGGANYYAQYEDVLASTEPQGDYVTAGRLFGLPDDVYSEYSDTVTVGPYPGDPNDKSVFMTYEGGPLGDLRCDIVVDQSVAKDIQEVHIRNLDTETTNQNVLSLSMWVAPASGDGNELDPTFDRQDKSSYSVQIFPKTGGGEGVFEPTFNSAGVDREADVTDVSRRYILMSIKSSFFGDLGTNTDDAGYNYYCWSSDISVLGFDSISRCSDVLALGLSLTSDVYEDCYVNMLDVDKLSEEWLACTVPGQTGCVQTSGGLPTYYIEPVPGGGIAVDGDLGEWPADSEWILLDKLYDGALPYPSDIVGYAKYSMRWDDSDNKIYVAVVVEDTDHFFEDDPNGSYSSSDRIEIYSQGDAAGGTGWGAGGSENFDVAQQYMVGPDTGSGRWALWPDFNAVDPAALTSAVTVTGDQIVYELAVTQYDNYGGISGGATNITNLGVGSIIGFDVVLGTVSSVSGYDMLSENTFTEKSLDAGQFQQYELANSLPQQYCGDWGYLDSDIVPDCRVNLEDFAVLGLEYLKCNDPEGDCVNNW